MNVAPGLLSPIVVIELVVAAVLTGLIWTIQLVHYPLFASVGTAEFPAYEAAHTQAITVLVGPLMVAEVALAIAALSLAPSWARGVAGGLVVVIWASTALVSVPLHAKLAPAFDAAAHASLVTTNWVRTAAWTTRTAILAWLVWTGTAGR